MATATQVESFCESCGTRYAFEPRRSRGRHLARVGRLVGILPDDADIDSSALVVSRDPFHGAFHFCLECRRFTCPSCWDAAAGFCRSCAMATGSSAHDALDDHAPDPETEALLQSTLASLMLLGTSEEWLRLEPPPAPRAEIWAAPPELVETPEDELSPMIEAGLAVLGAKAVAEAERAQAEAEQRRLAEELRLEEERLYAEQAEQLRAGQEAEQARLAWEADQYRLAQEAEFARQAAEADQYRMAQDADLGRQAAEAEHHRLALEAAALYALATPDQAEQPAIQAEPPTIQAEQLPPPEWAAMAASLGPDVETTVTPGPLLEQPAAAPHVESVDEVASPVMPVELVAAEQLQPVAQAVAPSQPVAEWTVPPPSPETVLPAAMVLEPVVPEAPAPVAPAAFEPVPTTMPAQGPIGEAALPPAAWAPPPAPPVMPPHMPPPPPPVAWQMTAPVTDPRGQWSPPPPPPGWIPNRMPMAAMSLPPAPRGSRSGFAATPTVGPVKGGVRPCPRCDLPLSGQARFCRRCGLPQV